MHRIHLSRRNLQTLLDKLNAGRAQAAIMKNDLNNRTYPTSTPTLVVAVEDHLYYAHLNGDGIKELYTPPSPPAVEPEPPTSAPTTLSKRRRKT